MTDRRQTLTGRRSSPALLRTIQRATANMVVRASAALGCRRALWYAATNYEPTNPAQTTTR